MIVQWPRRAYVLCLVTALAAACSSTKLPARSATTVTTITTTAPTVSTTSVAATTVPPTTTLPASTTGAPVTTSAVTIASTIATTTTATVLAAPSATAAVSTDAARVVNDLIRLDTQTRDKATSIAEREGAGRTLQIIYRALARDDEQAAVVVGRVPDALKPFVLNNIAAARAPLDPTLSKAVAPPPTVPDWTIRAPKPVEELLGYYREAEALTGIEWTYVAAINLVETRFGRIVGPSSAQALGPMQFLPTTWNGFCEGDIWNDHDAIICAARYLKNRGGPANMHRAVQGYNPNDMYERMVMSYAANLRADPETLVGYHGWQVFVPTTIGPVRLPEGYSAATPIDAATYLRDHPGDRAV
jgi:membrane-bound lytic murein transglycosylase B